MGGKPKNLLKIEIEIPMYDYEVNEILEGQESSSYSGLVGEVWSTIYNYKNTKGKSLDGLHSIRYKLNWDIE